MSVAPPLDPRSRPPETAARPAPAGHERAWTAEQQRAIERREGDLLLDAGAGSGKTSVLVERFVRVGARRRRRRLGDPHDHLHREGRGRAARPDPGAAARARRRRGGAARPRARSSRRSTASAPGCCAPRAGRRPGPAVRGARPRPVRAAGGGGVRRGARRSWPARGRGRCRRPDRRLRPPVAARGDARRLRPAALGRRSCTPGCPRSAAGADARPRTAARRARRGGAALGRRARARSPTRAAACSRRSSGSARCQELVVGPATCGRPSWTRAAARATAPRSAPTPARATARRWRATGRACAAGRRGRCATCSDTLLAALRRRYAERKRAVSGVDFEDLELLTPAAAARTTRSCASATPARFERIMVDELQDTNRVQLELIESIARGNLFTVGDAQQSIYGFRHADVELFERRGERAGGAGRARDAADQLPLAAGDPGRAQPRVRDGAGRAVHAAAPGRAGDAAPAGPSRPSSCCSSTRAPTGSSREWPSPWRLAEARALAERVAELVAAGRAPGEIVVLMRATTDMRAYERALERRGLPTYVIGGRGYWSHPQVRRPRRLPAGAGQPARRGGALRGARLAAGRGLARRAGGARGGGRERGARSLVAAARAARRDLAALDDADRRALATFAAGSAGSARARRGCGIEELIDSRAARSGYDLAMLAMPGGRRRLANVRKLMRLGREHEAEHGPDCAGFWT